MFKRTTRHRTDAPGEVFRIGQGWVCPEPATLLPAPRAVEQRIAQLRDAYMGDLIDTIDFILAMHTVDSSPSIPDPPSRRMWWGTRESDRPTREHTHCARGHELPPAHWHASSRKDCGCPVCDCATVEVKIVGGGRRYVEVCGCGSRACTDRKGRWSPDRAAAEYATLQARTAELSKLYAETNRMLASHAMPPAIRVDRPDW